MTTMPSPLPPCPEGKYRTIYADPPWPYRGTQPAFRHIRAQQGDEAARYAMPYQTMSIAAIGALPVTSLADTNAHLYLWTTNRFLPDAFAIARQWGFTYSTTLVWCKSPRGMTPGPAYMVATEYVLFCRRGTLKAKRRVDRNWWQWPRRIRRTATGITPQHSGKPDAFQDMIEQVSPGPYLELFARRQRLGWSAWGDQVASTIAMAAD